MYAQIPSRNIISIFSITLKRCELHQRFLSSKHSHQINFIKRPSYSQSLCIHKRLLSLERKVNSNCLSSECNKLLRQIDSEGYQPLEDKYIPIRSSKSRAEGETSHHFKDYCQVKVEGGNGGSGSISFLQVLCNPNAGPDGGDGGNGGHVIFTASSRRKSLNHLKPVIRGESGEGGKCYDRIGKNALDTIVEVPNGTLVKHNDTLLAELSEEGDVFLAARGGAGGKGNSFFATSVNQTPRIAQFGGRGESFSFEIELRVIAEIGLIGFPNAGKSTLLRAVSRSRPKVASYPFTTLVPHVGVVTYEDQRQMAVADIPGLIEGSHSNLGLGMAFLKHIQRCVSLLYVLDASDEDPLRQLSILKNELEFYENGLSSRPHAIVLNKMDLPQAKDKVAVVEKETGLPVIPISAKMGHNLGSLFAAMRLLADWKPLS